MKNPETSHSMKGYLCVAAAAIMWASSGTAGKALFTSGVTPFELVQIRVTVSTVLLTIVFGIWFRPLFKIRPRDLWYFFLLGGVVMALVQVTYFYAISKIQVAAAIFLQYLAPIMVAFFPSVSGRNAITATLEPISAGLFAYLFIGEPLQPLQIAGDAMVVAAIVVLQLKKEQDELCPANIRRAG